MQPEFTFRKLTEVPRLSLAERDRRWAGLSEEMALRELDGLLLFSGGDGTSSANLRYLTDVAAAGVGFFPFQGEPVIYGGLPHTSVYHQGSQDWVKRFRGGARPEEIVATVKEMGCEKGKIGVVGYGSQNSRMVGETIPYSSFSKIQKLLPDAVFTNESPLLEKMRMIKSEEELEMLAQAAETAHHMFEALKDSARAAKPECELYANMLQVSLSRGGELSMILLDVGKTPLLHGRGFPYSRRPLEKGDMIVIEWHASFGGYQVGVEHSLSLGEPDPHYLEIHKVSSEVFDRLMEKLKPGVTMEEVIAGMRKPVEEAGMAHVEVGIHGHGLASPEFPTVVFGGPSGLVQGHPMGRVPPIIIKENMVFGVNIDVSDPRWRKDSGLMCGDTVAVTKTGARKLTKVPIELTII